MFTKIFVLCLCLSAALAAAIPTESHPEHLQPAEHESLETANTFGLGFYKGFHGGPYGYPHYGYGWPYGGYGYGYGYGFGHPFFF